MMILRFQLITRFTLGKDYQQIRLATVCYSPLYVISKLGATPGSPD